LLVVLTQGGGRYAPLPWAMVFRPFRAKTKSAPDRGSPVV